MKKNILYLHAGAELYGADKVLLELIKNVNRSLYNPIVVLPCEGPLVEEFFRNKIDVRVIKYPILRRKYFNPKGIFIYLKDYFIYSKKIKEIMIDEKIRLIHINTTAVLEGIYLKLKLKARIIWHVHEIITKPKLINKFICFCLSRYSDKIVVVSEAVKGHLLESRWLNEDEIIVIYNGVYSYKKTEIEEIRNNVQCLKEKVIGNKSSIVVGMIGRINSWKGQEDFLRAITVLLKKQANIHCLIVGSVFEGEEWREEKLKKLIESSSFSENIHLINFQKNIINYHMMIDIFVLPSTNPDPLPTVVLEAMSLGKVVVGYTHGGINEMVASPTVVLTSPRDTQSLAEKIEFFVNNPEARYFEGEKNKMRQQSFFDKKKYSENFLSLYDEVLNS